MSVARKIPASARPDPDPHAGYPAPGPAARLLAKAADFFAYPFLVGTFLAILHLMTRNSLFVDMAAHPVFPFFMWFGFPLFDALIHHGTGTTPGKWLLGFATVPKQNGSFFAHLSRSSQAFVIGAGALTPLAIVTLFFALNRYQRSSETGWDHRLGFRTYAYRTPWVGGVFVLLFLTFIGYAAAQQLQKVPGTF